MSWRITPITDFDRVGLTALRGSLCGWQIATGSVGRSTFAQLEIPRAR